MSKKKYNVIVIDGEDSTTHSSLDYVIIKNVKKNKKVYKLKRSMGDVWNSSVKGELLLTLTDNGNGFKVKHGFTPRFSEVARTTHVLNLGYDEFFEFKILLDFISDSDKNLFPIFKIKRN